LRERERDRQCMDNLITCRIRTAKAPKLVELTHTHIYMSVCVCVCVCMCVGV